MSRETTQLLEAFEALPEEEKRFTRLNFGTLQIDVPIKDPKAYTEPFTVRVMQQFMPDTQLFESVCEDRDAVHYLGDPEYKQKEAKRKAAGEK